MNIGRFIAAHKSEIRKAAMVIGTLAGMAVLSTLRKVPDYGEYEFGFVDDAAEEEVENIVGKPAEEEETEE